MNKLVIIALSLALSSPAFVEAGNAARVSGIFGPARGTHSLETDRNMTGPSLAGLWGRKAGSPPSFERYSDALKSPGIIWDNRSLDGWLTDPDAMVPDNEMPFNGIKDARDRADLLVFLKEATKPAPPRMSRQGGTGGMGGMMGGMMVGGRATNLKSLEPNMQVKAITYCHDTYRVTTGDGKKRAFLGTQPAPENGRQQRGSAKWRTGPSARGNDGR